MIILRLNISIGSFMKKYAAIIMLVVAVALAALAGWLGFSYLEQRETALRSELEQIEEPVSLVVAKSDLYPGDIIGETTMAVRDIPRQYVPSGAIEVDAFNAVEGLRLQVPMRSGSALIQAFIAGAPGVGSFAELLRPGERAVTLEVSPLKSVEGMIKTGDHIDLVLMRDTGSSASEGAIDSSLVNLLDNVAVLATGMQTLADMNIEGNEELYTSITMGVPVEKITEVLTASGKGEIFFLLRHPDDDRVARFGDHDSGPTIEAIAGGKANEGVLSSRHQPIEGGEKERMKRKESSSGRIFRLADNVWSKSEGAKSNNVVKDD